jgi:hypothetical protein
MNRKDLRSGKGAASQNMFEDGLLIFNGPVIPRPSIYTDFSDKAHLIDIPIPDINVLRMLCDQLRVQAECGAHVLGVFRKFIILGPSARSSGDCQGVHPGQLRRLDRCGKIRVEIEMTMEVDVVHRLWFQSSMAL